MKRLQLYYWYIGLPVLMVVLGSVLFFDAIMSTVKGNPHPQINYIIFVLVAAGCYQMLAHVRRINREGHLFRQYRRMVQNDISGEEVETLLKDLTKEYDVLPLIQLIQGLRGTALSSVQHSAVESEMERFAARQARRLMLAQFMGGLMVGMGLLGTFIGLLGALAEIGKLIGSFNLGAGLSDYFQWLDNGKNRWLDIDLPDVVALRQQLMPHTDARRETRIGDLRTAGWWNRLGLQRHNHRNPLLLISEGVLMYMQPTEVKVFFQEIGEHALGVAPGAFAADVAHTLHVLGRHGLAAGVALAQQAPVGRPAMAQWPPVGAEPGLEQAGERVGRAQLGLRQGRTVEIVDRPEQIAAPGRALQLEGRLQRGPAALKTV